MNAMLGDEELERLLAEAAQSFAVPEPQVEAPARRARVVPDWWPKAVAGVAVLAIGTAFAVGASHGSRTFSDTSKSFSNGAVGGTTGGTGADLAPTSVDRAPAAVPQAGSVQAPSGASTYSGGAASAGGATATDDGDTARIVRTGTITLAVGKGRVRDAVTALDDLVASVRGYAADSTSNEVGDDPNAQLTYRVPVASFHAVIQKVRAMKVEVVSVSETGKDVTATYADTQAQIESLKAARSRFLAILAKAKTIGDTLSVQQRVDDVQKQIDRLEGQRRVLADQSDYATLTVSVSEKGNAAKALVAPSRSGWSKAWHDATHGFTSGVQGIIGASGRTLLVLICLALLALVGQQAWRFARRRLV